MSDHAGESRNGNRWEEWTVRALGASGIAVSVLDFSGALDGTQLKDRVPTMTLLLVSGIVLLLAGAFVARLDALLAAIRTVRQVAESETTERMLELLGDRLDPTLKRLYFGLTGDLLNAMRGALVDRTLESTNRALFRHGFLQTFRLEQYRRSTFYATSIADPEYFWDPQTVEAMRVFTAGGGNVHRVFFIRAADDLKNPRIRQTLNEQCQARVSVEVVLLDTVGPIADDLNRLFVVDADATIAWEVRTDESKRIRWMQVTTDRACARKYIDRFMRIRAELSPVPYSFTPDA